MTHPQHDSAECEHCAAVAAADERGRMWAAGPERGKQARVNVEVETEAGTYQAPATIDPETARAMRYEAAGWERDPETGQYRPGSFYPVGGPE